MDFKVSKAWLRLTVAAAILITAVNVHASDLVSNQRTILCTEYTCGAPIFDGFYFMRNEFAGGSASQWLFVGGAPCSLGS